MVLQQDIPSHIAIIMDGNARWAKKNSFNVAAGHKKGSKVIKEIVKSAAKLGVKFLTIYAFSTENWQRPKEEVGGLMSLLKNYLGGDVNELIKNDVKIVVSGSLENIDAKIVDQINKIVEKTKNNQAITLNVAFDYGARKELASACKQIALALKEGKISVSDIDESYLSKNLYQPTIPDPDLLIRSGGNIRLSNFLLWQLAYTELYFCQTLWPDFTEKDLIQAITNFNQRKRNYGKR